MCDTDTLWSRPMIRWWYDEMVGNLPRSLCLILLLTCDLMMMRLLPMMLFWVPATTILLCCSVPIITPMTYFFTMLMIDCCACILPYLPFCSDIQMPWCRDELLMIYHWCKSNASIVTPCHSIPALTYTLIPLIPAQSMPIYIFSTCSTILTCAIVSDLIWCLILCLQLFCSVNCCYHLNLLFFWCYACCWWPTWGNTITLMEIRWCLPTPIRDAFILYFFYHWWWQWYHLEFWWYRKGRRRGKFWKGREIPQMGKRS